MNLKCYKSIKFLWIIFNQRAMAGLPAETLRRASTSFD